MRSPVNEPVVVEPRAARASPGDGPKKIFVVDDIETVRLVVAHSLTVGGYEVATFGSGEACLEALGGLLPDAIFLDLDMPGLSGLETLSRIRAVNPHVPVIILTASDELESVVAAIKAGAYDYLVKPSDRRKLLTTARNAVEKFQLSLQVVALERESQGGGLQNLIGDSPPMRELYRQMDRLSASEISLLLCGESGTGKEVVARAIHERSSRRAGPFVALNCAAIPEHLIESELFGHERGAFTGATEQRVGKFELAHNGVLFLDEVGELHKAVQAKLLRVLQERVFHRVGGNREIGSDFRLIAATHQDLATRVQEHSFREDLYFRIAVFELHVPPLRERGKDVLLLAEHFRRIFSREEGRHAEFSRDAFEVLLEYRWPGNVRELQNAVQRAVVLADDGVIRSEFLLPSSPSGNYDGEGTSRPTVHTAHAGPSREPGLDIVSDTDTDTDLELDLMRLERRATEAALRRHRGDARAMAAALGVSRATLYRKLKKHGLRLRQ